MEINGKKTEQNIGQKKIKTNRKERVSVLESEIKKKKNPENRLR